MSSQCHPSFTKPIVYAVHRMAAIVTATVTEPKMIGGQRSEPGKLHLTALAVYWEGCHSTGKLVSTYLKVLLYF